MSLFAGWDSRTVLPRWRSFETTASIGELFQPREKAAASDASELRELVDSWASNRTRYHAADLVGAAIVLGQETLAVEPARFLADPASASSEGARQLARQLLCRIGILPSGESSQEPPNLQSTGGSIAATRRQLRTDPRNAVAWVELARLYTTLGLLEKANAALERALALAPNTRFVLRAAARFFVHAKEPSRAQRLLLKSDTLKTDPWLLAAELAVATAGGLGPESAKQARRLLASSSLPKSQLSEVASALGTLELAAGSSRKARQLLRESLDHPTENSVAQAEWASQSTGIALLSSVKEYDVPLLHEAVALQAFESGDWREASQQSLEWFRDQAFSSRPAILNAYVNGSVLGDHSAAIKTLEVARPANETDTLLLNNLAFSKIEMGDLDEAETILRQAAALSSERGASVALTATAGLLEFRRGRAEIGRQLYERALEMAANWKLAKHEALGSIMLAREELRADSERVVSALERARRLAGRRREADVRALMERLAKEASDRRRSESDGHA